MAFCRCFGAPLCRCWLIDISCPEKNKKKLPGNLVYKINRFNFAADSGGNRECRPFSGINGLFYKPILKNSKTIKRNGRKKNFRKGKPGNHHGDD